MGGYQQIFGGSAVYPSNQTYTAIALTGDLVLSWPIESVSSETIVADLMDFTPGTPGGWNVNLPDATGGSNGITMIISNLSGAFDFNVNDSASNLVLNVPPGTVWLVYLTDNSTQAGVWRSFQYGAQAGSVNVAAIAGAGLLAIGSSLNQSMPVLNKSTNYTAVVDDRASVILWTGAGGTVTLPSAAAAQSNWFINIRNSGTGALTVSPPSGNIDGSASKIFAAGSGSAIVFCDGSNYYSLGFGGSSTGGNFDYTTLNCAGSDGVNNPIVLSGGQLDRISYKCFGILTGTRTIIVPNSVQQYWINNQTTSSGGPWTLTIKTAAGGGQTVAQPGQAILYCDSTDVQVATSGVTLPVPVSSGGTGATTAPAALTNLGGSATGTALFTASSAHVARFTVLGAGTVGENIFLAATASVALTAMAGGTLTGALTVTGLITAGTATVTGVVTAGGLSVNGSSVPTNGGIYSQSAGFLSFASHGFQAGWFDLAQKLNLVHPLDIAQGGTGSTTLAAAAAALGDSTATASTLALRTGGADLYARAFNMNLAVDTTTAIDNVMFNDNGTGGFLRRATLARFASTISPSITPDALSTASGSAPSFSARAWARVSSSGTLISGQNVATAGRSALGIYFITFTTAMADTNYAVIATALHVTGNFIVAASEADSTQITKTTSQVGVYVGVPGASLDTQISIVIYR